MTRHFSEGYRRAKAKEVRLGAVLLLVLGVALGACSSGAGALDRSLGVRAANAADPDAFDTGLSHLKAGRKGNAAMYLEEALMARPDDIRVLNALGAAYDGLGRPDLAVRLYRRALAKAPEDARTLNNLGYSYLLQDRVDLAVTYLSDAEQLLVERGDAAPGQLRYVRSNLAAIAFGDGAHPTAMAFASGLDYGAGGETAETVKSLPRLLRSGRTDQLLVTRGDSLDAAAGVTHDIALAAARASTARPSARRAPVIAIQTQARLPALEEEPVRGAAALSLANARIELSNGAGLLGMAASFSRHLDSAGIAVARLTNAARFDYGETTVFHRPGFAEAARVVARELGVASDVQLAPDLASDIRIRLGGDLVPFARSLQSNRKGVV